MNGSCSRPVVVASFVLAMVSLHVSLCGPPATAAIYRWDNGALITDKFAEPYAYLDGMDLSYADLVDGQLDNARFNSSNLTQAHLMGADLTRANFRYATLADADFAGAVITGADFEETTSRGFMAEQLYSTASYQNADLSEIELEDNDLTGWSFVGQNLTKAQFFGTTLADADFSGAVIMDADFRETTSRGFTAEQLYSTASYQSGDLGIGLVGNDLTGWNFAGKNLSKTAFAGATLADADFTGAVVAGAYFGDTTSRGFTAQQLYSTASYQTGDLTGIGLGLNDLTGWNFAGKNLTNAGFSQATLTDADFTGAVVTRASFSKNPNEGFTAEQLYSTASYQQGDLTRMSFAMSDLTGWNFAGKNLTEAGFWEATLTGADFTGAVITGALFWDTTGRGFTREQLYSTASYRDGDLSGVYLDGNDLTGWNFAGQNLTKAKFSGATLTGADFTGAVVTSAIFHDATSRGFTAEQLYSTASYQDGDLTDIRLKRNDLTGWNFATKKLRDADFWRAILINADFSDADLTQTYFSGATFTDADLSGAVVTGATFSGTVGFTAGQLYSTASYQSGDLSAIRLRGNDLSGWNFAAKNLTDADFDYAVLTNADFTGAVVTKASFQDTTSRGFTPDQLYSTASYREGDLRGLVLNWNDLRAWDFAGKNLTEAVFYAVMLTDADFGFADLRGARIANSQLATVRTEATIRPDGQINSLELDAAERLIVRDYDGETDIPITVRSLMSVDPDGALQMVFQDTDWGSTISFEPGIDVSLGGTLELFFDDDIRPADLVGTTFDLFDWEGVTVVSQFDQIVTQAEAVWDTSNLYTAGEVTLLAAVPEPSTLMLLAMAAAVAAAGWLLGAGRHRKK